MLFLGNGELCIQNSGFWQLPLAKDSQKYTAFTVHNLGQFEWTRTSQGLHSAPSQYQRLMELTTKGLRNIIVYIDDLLVHTSDHVAHRQSLQLLFDRLRKANLKLNLKKCFFVKSTWKNRKMHKTKSLKNTVFMILKKYYHGIF